MSDIIKIVEQNLCDATAVCWCNKIMNYSTAQQICNVYKYTGRPRFERKSTLTSIQHLKKNEKHNFAGTKCALIFANN